MKRGRKEPAALGSKKAKKPKKVQIPFDRLGFVPENTPLPEKGYVDSGNTTITLGNGTADFATAGASLLNGIAPGTGMTQRKGRKVLMTSFQIRWNFKFGATVNGSGAVRIAVVYDKQANAAAPTAALLFTADNFLSPLNLSNSDRFEILYSKVSKPIAITNEQTDQGDFYRKLNHAIHFNTGTAGDITDITTGSVYLFAAQSGGIGSTAAPQLIFDTRIRFIDN